MFVPCAYLTFREYFKLKYLVLTLLGMDSLHQRLENVLDYLYNKGVVRNKVQFGKRIGKSKSQVSDAFKDRPGYCTNGLMETIADAFPDILNRDYLLTGEGEVGLPDKNLRPHYPATVAAGVLSGDVAQVMDYDVEMEPIIKRFGHYDYMIDVDGDSMEPTYYTGDAVACRKLEDKNELTSGKAYVFVTRDGAVLKRYVSSTSSSVCVSSDNSKYKPYPIDQDSILGIAEVVGSVSGARNKRSDRIELSKEDIYRLLDGLYVTPKTPDVDKELLESRLDRLFGSLELPDPTDYADN